MSEHRTSDHRPTLDDYCSMMRDTHASDQLRNAVLSKTRARRNGERPAFFKSSRIKILAIAACLVLLVGLGTTALALNSSIGFGNLDDKPAEPAEIDASPGTGTEEESGNSATLHTEQFTGGGGYSGPWYNPADDTFWSYEWAGYKYHFPVYCTGNNIESITYEIEGERSYFEIIDKTVTAEQHANGVHTYHYTKSVTFDYDHQESIDDERIVELYIGFPLSDSGLEAYSTLRTRGYSEEASRQLDTAVEKSAAEDILTSRLTMTVTYADGSSQTKAYTIDPVPGFDELYAQYHDAREAFRDVEPPKGDATSEEIDDFQNKMPQMPKLYTITEVVEG